MLPVSRASRVSRVRFVGNKESEGVVTKCACSTHRRASKKHTVQSLILLMPVHSLVRAADCAEGRLYTRRLR